jgi:hypothetical protein
MGFSTDGPLPRDASDQPAAVTAAIENVVNAAKR